MNLMALIFSYLSRIISLKANDFKVLKFLGLKNVDSVLNFDTSFFIFVDLLPSLIRKNFPSAV